MAPYASFPSVSHLFICVCNHFGLPPSSPLSPSFPGPASSSRALVSGATSVGETPGREPWPEIRSRFGVPLCAACARRRRLRLRGKRSRGPPRPPGPQRALCMDYPEAFPRPHRYPSGTYRQVPPCLGLRTHMPSLWHAYLTRLRRGCAKTLASYLT